MKISEALNHEELKQFSKATDIHGIASLITTWGLISLAFILASIPFPLLPRIFALFISLIILGGRQLALAILMHDCSHYSLFQTRWLNDFAGKWLAGYPVWQDLQRYRTHHLAHHRDAGSSNDPDSSLVTGYPTSRASLARKFLRDLTGITGIKRIFGLLLMDFGFIKYTAASDKIPLHHENRTFKNILVTGIRNLHGVFITNIILFLLLKSTGHAELYGLWVIAYLTTFSLFVRIRSIAEHACTSTGSDPLENTRTTQANLLARITVAPHYVNHHLEHHLLMNVPSFRLPKLHQTLKRKGKLEKAYLASGYIEVLKNVTNSK